MIDIRIIICFLLIAAFIGFEVAGIQVDIKVKMWLACSFGAFIGLCLAYIDERKK